MGDEVLVRGVFHIGYEITSFVGALLLSSNFELNPADIPAAFRGQAIRNGAIELRILHARNLLEFLLSSESRKTHYRADEYFPDWKVPDREALQKLKTRCCEHTFHLSKSRVTDEEHRSGLGDKSWPFRAFAPLVRATVAFAEKLLDSEYVGADADGRPPLTLACQALREMFGMEHANPGEGA
jgi:hypothetical protein